MKKLFNYTDEAQNLIKSKIETTGIKLGYKPVWGLLNELEEKVENVEIEKGSDEKSIVINGAEYLVLTDEEADKLAYEMVENLIEDCGVRVFDLNLTHYLDENFMDDLFGECVAGHVADMTEEELEEKLNEYEADDEDDLIEKMIDQNEIEDYFDEDELIDIAAKYGKFDYEEIIKDVLRFDSRGHVISVYDGEEIEIRWDDEWFYAYRMD